MIKFLIALIGLGIVGVAAAPGGAAGTGQTQAGTPLPAIDKPGLLIIDIQNFYFAGGKIPLQGSVEASLKAKTLIESFRAKKLPVIHIRHMPKQDPATKDPQYAIHPNVAPLAGEPVVIKHYANAFRETDLQSRLQALGVKTIVVCGMQTQMCVEAATRHGADLGYDIVLVDDACATRDLSYGGVKVPAASVHAAVLAAMSGTYAKVVTAADVEKILK
jgi:nicotinamidase-related amidase